MVAFAGTKTMAILIVGTAQERVAVVAEIKTSEVTGLMNK